ncbi:zinc finger protein [Cinnamomum micranthum f. kanehirae]|uniref:Zinc finger protein n=1 Tax=Cinnamomum micranthum f. kanehirae TaxID=337451 RepID=A0A3S3NVV0_9MAGN|nr:zinc finger protein [Cinnamomum micranthum f. kanehirae]
MSAKLETTGKHQVEVHFVDAGAPCLIEENFEGYYLEYGDAGLQDLLQDQETVYQSHHANSGNEITKASASTGSSPDTKQSGGNRKMENEGESSQGDAVESQLALDEAVARALQELEDQLAGTSFSESTGTESDKDDPSSAHQERTPTQDSTVNREHNSADTNSVVRQDGIDPDNMTYEELQSLGEAIGTQSKGLSDELISYLPSSKYKTGFFSRKEKHEECVICCMAYKNREILITLPCQHQYHSKCITEWLRINKACPVCTVEVFGS